MSGLFARIDAPDSFRGRVDLNDGRVGFRVRNIHSLSRGFGGSATVPATTEHSFRRSLSRQQAVHIMNSGVKQMPIHYLEVVFNDQLPGDPEIGSLRI